MSEREELDEHQENGSNQDRLHLQSRSSGPTHRDHSYHGFIDNRENPSNGRCLGVFGLSIYTQERYLKNMFAKYGPIEDVQIVYDAQSGRSRGFAFVYYEDKNDAALVADPCLNAKERCNGIEIDGRKIRVDFSITQRAHTPTPGIYMGKPTGVGVNIGNGSAGRKKLLYCCESEVKAMPTQTDWQLLSEETGAGDVAKHLKKRRKSYQCSECPKIYSKSQYVKDHIRTVHYHSNVNYSCRVCGQTFGWRVTTLKHIKKYHSVENTTAMIDQLF